MALPERITKTDAAELIGITRVTLDKRIADGAYSWPPESWTALFEEAVEFKRGGSVVDDDKRFRAARADIHEIEAAKERGAWAPVDLFEEQIVSVFGLFVQEAEGAEARLCRSAGVGLSEAVTSEFRSMRENLARGVERYCESLEERARSSASVATEARRRVGAGGEDLAAGERGAGSVSGLADAVHSPVS